MIRRLAEKVWAASRKESRIGRAVVLKLKTSNFDILTRSCTPSAPPASCEEVTNIALSLRERVGLDPGHQFSLNRRRPQQFSRFRRFSRPISSFRVTRNCASKQHSVLAESGFSTGRSDTADTYSPSLCHQGYRGQSTRSGRPRHAEPRRESIWNFAVAVDDRQRRCVVPSLHISSTIVDGCN